MRHAINLVEGSSPNSEESDQKNSIAEVVDQTRPSESEYTFRVVCEVKSGREKFDLSVWSKAKTERQAKIDGKKHVAAIYGAFAKVRVIYVQSRDEYEAVSKLRGYL